MGEINTPYRAELESAKTVFEVLNRLEGANGDALRAMFSDFKILFGEAPGSRGSHHFWRGGWLDHMDQMVQIYRANYELATSSGWNNTVTTSERFGFQEGLEVILLHDLEKPFKYAHMVADFVPMHEIVEFVDIYENKDERKLFRQRMIRKYGIELNENQLNALLYIEGVRDADYQPGFRIDLPLAALCHVCDDLSSRFGYNNPGGNYRGEIPVVRQM